MHWELLWRGRGERRKAVLSVFIAMNQTTALADKIYRTQAQSLPALVSHSVSQCSFANVKIDVYRDFSNTLLYGFTVQERLKHVAKSTHLSKADRGFSLQSRTSGVDEPFMPLGWKTPTMTYLWF